MAYKGEDAANSDVAAFKGLMTNGLDGKSKDKSRVGGKTRENTWEGDRRKNYHSWAISGSICQGYMQVFDYD
jgi:hypothetical protein